MPQPGYGYQQQLVPGMRPGGRGPVPNYFMPMVQQQQQRPGGGRRPGGIQQSQHQVLSQFTIKKNCFGLLVSL